MGNEERLTAATALRLGLVTEVVPRAELWERAHEIAAEIAARRPEAVQGTVRAIWESLEMPRTIALQNGLSYTQLGNPRKGERPPLAPKRPHRLR
jgi:enoyl-CoA hydratase/carnithine racemase